MMTHEATVHVKAKVSFFRSWFEPRTVSFSAIPNALHDTTERDPTSEQIATYTST